MTNYRYQFTVSVKTDGGVDIEPREVGEDGVVETTANIFNIIDTARKLAADLERQVLLDSVRQSLLEALPPIDAPLPPSAVVKDALAERGITPEVPATPAEDTPTAE